MGKRVERIKKQKKEKYKKILEGLIILNVTIILCLGLKVTETAIQELTCVKGQNIFEIGFNQRKPYIELFGKIYNLDFEDLYKKITKTIK